MAPPAKPEKKAAFGMDEYRERWKDKANKHDDFPTGYFATPDGKSLGISNWSAWSISTINFAYAGFRLPNESRLPSRGALVFLRPYAQAPFQSLQGVLAVSLADDRIPWSSSLDALRDAMAAVLQALPLTLPNGTCEEPAVDAVLGRSALEARCNASAQGVTYAMRFRVVAAARGLVCQFANWTDDTSKAWAETFWRSMKPTEASAVSVPAKLLASRLGAIRMQ